MQLLSGLVIGNAYTTYIIEYVLVTPMVILYTIVIVDYITTLRLIIYLFQDACATIGIILHYLFLVAISWLLCECILIFILIQGSRRNIFLSIYFYAVIAWSKYIANVVHVIYVTWAGVICLICTHKHEGVDILGKSLTTHVTRCRHISNCTCCICYVTLWQQHLLNKPTIYHQTYHIISARACGPWASGVHIRQTTHAMLQL